MFPIPPRDCSGTARRFRRPSHPSASRPASNFCGSLAHLREAGGVLYRGPMKIDEELWMCQFRDPWGNCIGIRGPMVAEVL